MLSHLLRQRTHTNTCEVVDGESDVARIVLGEETLKVLAHHVVAQPRLEFGHTHLFHHVLEQNLDEDTATRCSLFLVQMYH
jgi:hypothetical protein